jgi:hypothetical protein
VPLRDPYVAGPCFSNEYFDPCSETTAYGEERPLKQCDISEVVINGAALALWSYCRGSHYESRGKAAFLMWNLLCQMSIEVLHFLLQLSRAQAWLHPSDHTKLT